MKVRKFKFINAKNLINAEKYGVHKKYNYETLNHREKFSVSHQKLTLMSL